MAQQQVLILKNGTERLVVPKLIGYSVQYNKLWSEDSGRDLAGNNHKKLVGVFPKIEAQVGSFTQNEMKAFLPFAIASNIEYEYYDELKGMVSITTGAYMNDVTIELKHEKTKEYKPFSFAIIPDKKRV